jgi:chromatin remodeling complex protein RSC6|tara:strand:- start:551 stop:1186 length:636 start_codon:yes stop_codon:yes gene_type:complete
MKKTSTTAATKKKPVQENKSAATDKKVAAPKKTQSKVVEEVKKVEPVVVEKSLGDTLISELGEKIVSVQGELKSMQQTLKLLVKEYEKQKKVIAKVQKKRENAKKSPSGFAKPCKISSELCKFVGVPEGTEKSRTDITRYINAYVKEKNLNNPENRREFFPDDKLRAILNVKEKEKVTYFILQRLIAHHFPLSINKQNALAAQAAAEAAKK